MKSACVLAVALCLAGCSKNIDTPEAVKDGVVKDISKKGMDVNNMDVSVDSVSFREKEATAQVSFRPKGSPPGTQGVTMNYALERDGNEWRIKNRNLEGHEQAKPGSSQMPPGHPTTGTAGGQQMPAGHPQVSPGAQQ